MVREWISTAQQNIIHHVQSQTDSATATTSDKLQRAEENALKRHSDVDALGKQLRMQMNQILESCSAIPAVGDKVTGLSTATNAGVANVMRELGSINRSVSSLSEQTAALIGASKTHFSGSSQIDSTVISTLSAQRDQIISVERLLSNLQVKMDARCVGTANLT